MFKKVLLASAVLAATTSVALANGGDFTAPAPVAPAPVGFIGAFYAGVGVSADSSNIKFDRTRTTTVQTVNGLGTITGVDTFSNRYNAESLGAWGVDGTAFIGYGGSFNNQWYLGLEIFGDITSLEHKSRNRLSESFASYDPDGTGTVISAGTSSATPVRFNIKKQWGLGVDLRPGYMLTDATVLYGIIGYEYSRWKMDGYVDGINGDNVFGFTTSSRNFSNKDKNENGFRLGLGMGTNITRNVQLRGDYVHTWYQSFNRSVATSGAFSATDGSGTVFYTTTANRVNARPMNDAFTLGVVWNFV